MSGLEALPPDLIERIVEMAAPLGDLTDAAYLRLGEEGLGEALDPYGHGWRTPTRMRWLFRTSRLSKTIYNATATLGFKHLLVTRIDQAERLIVGLATHRSARQAIRGLIYTGPLCHQEIEERVKEYMTEKAKAPEFELEWGEEWDRLRSNRTDDAKLEWQVEHDDTLARLLPLCETARCVYIETIKHPRYRDLPIVLPPGCRVFNGHDQVPDLGALLELAPSVVHLASPKRYTVPASIAEHLHTLHIGLHGALAACRSAPNLRVLSLPWYHSAAQLAVVLPQHMPSLVELQIVYHYRGTGQTAARYTPRENWRDPFSGIDQLLCRIPLQLKVLDLDLGYLLDEKSDGIVRALTSAVLSALPSGSSLCALIVGQLPVWEHEPSVIGELRKACKQRSIRLKIV